MGPDQLPFYGRVVEVDGSAIRTEHASLMEVFDSLALDVNVAEPATAGMEAQAADEIGLPEDGSDG